jgi:hypothetical protein
MNDPEIHRLMTQSGCGGTLTPAVRRFAQACAAEGATQERERWALRADQVAEELRGLQASGVREAQQLAQVAEDLAAEMRA